MSLRMRTRLVSWKQAFLQFCTHQLCITLVSWPIMLWWGLPVSFLSPLGNLIFSPFLTVFLVLSLLLAGTQLLFVPNGLLVRLLDLVVSFWLYLVSLAPASWSLVVQRPPFPLLLLPPLVAVFIMHYRCFASTSRKLAGLAAAAILLPLLFSLLPTVSSAPIPYASRRLIIEQADKKVSLTDVGSDAEAGRGPAGSRAAQDQWISYTLRPHLARQFGVQQLDSCRLTHLNPDLVELATQLCEKKLVRHLVVPHQPVTLVDELQRVCQKTGVELIFSPSSSSSVSRQRVSHHDGPHHELVKLRKRCTRGGNGASKRPFRAPQ